ncbi:MAG: c-type cytochrome biogenesis protein CcmI [Gammaproteobacteria bacterium]|nr:MAG: c-type cytochrome biogenesis protein CcmI [Gammaproteobacteria bacterium]
MMTFWIIAALMTGLGLLVLLLPLRRKVGDITDDARARNLRIAREKIAELDAELAAGTLDQATYDQAKEEVEQELLEDVALPDQHVAGGNSGTKAAMLMLLVLVPALGFGLYLLLGSPRFVDVAGAGSVAENPHAQGSDKAPTMAEIQEALEKRVKEQPEDAEAWFMLGRLYAGMQRFADAAKAYEQVAKLTDNHPQALIAWADALAMTQGGRLSGKPYELVKQALDQAPDDPTALWLAGQGAREANDYQNAIYYWRQAEAGLADKPDFVMELRDLIASAKRAAASAGVEVEDPGSSVDLAKQAGIELRLSIAPELQSKVKPDEPLFIFAKAVDGPPMPLAAIRMTAGELPREVVLTDANLLRGGKLTDHKQLKIGARIARSGQPMAASGDLQSAEVVVDVPASEPVELVIDQVVP